MCGLFGHSIFTPNHLENSSAALSTLAHRGPDHHGEWRDSNAYLGHQRLSIIDLSSSANQPMVSESGVVSTVNGEIYNHLQLRKQLDGDHHFTSESDSEVVLHGYREWGTRGLLERLEGMFAFAIYDKHKKSITLARDRVGIKPLYYALIDEQLIWSSELKAIIKYIPHKLIDDQSAIYDYLTYRYIPAPKTRFKNIFKLLPGHYLNYSIANPKAAIKSYWKLDVKQDRKLNLDYEDQFHQLLSNSVQTQVAADTPIGFFLSSGFDSTALAATANSQLQKINTFTVGFPGTKFNESDGASINADHLGSKHFSVDATPEEVSDLLPKMQDWFDEPFADSSSIPTFLVSKLARKYVAVVLSGDGGDEVAGGYRWYRNSTSSQLSHPFRTLLSAFLKHVPPLALNDLNIARYIFSPIETHVLTLGGMLKSEKTNYAEAWEIPSDYDDYWHFRRHYREDLPFRTRMQYLDFKTFLPDDVLTKVDRTSMQNSLEARVPWLDTALVEYFYSLPESVRYADNQLKGFARSCIQKKHPNLFHNQEKKGFGLPKSSRAKVASNRRERWLVTVLQHNYPTLALKDQLSE